MTPATEAQGLQTLSRLQAKAQKAEKAYEAAQAERNAQVLHLRETHGTGYRPMAEAMGLSRDRVAQLLREGRKASAT